MVREVDHRIAVARRKTVGVQLRPRCETQGQRLQDSRQYESNSVVRWIILEGPLTLMLCFPVGLRESCLELIELFGHLLEERHDHRCEG